MVLKIKTISLIKSIVKIIMAKDEGLLMRDECQGLESKWSSKSNVKKIDIF